MKTSCGKKPVRIHVLTGDSVLLVFDPKATVREVFDQVCSFYSIKENHFFGLSAEIENEPRFLDLKQRLSKYAPKEWCKELRRRDSDLSVQPSSVFTVQFQVQYFVEHPKLIRDPCSRYHYYLQMKKNVLQSKIRAQDELIFTLAATSLHLDVGTFDSETHKGHYFDPSDYVPAWFTHKWSNEYLRSHLPTMHAELTATSPFEAQADYIRQASCIDDVPVHYYKLYKTKKESDPSVVLGIFHQGLRIHHVTKDGTHLLDFEFPWAKVGRLYFAARRFEIHPEDQPSSRRLTYYTGSQTRSKYLLRLLRETHSLYMSLTPFVQHMRKVDVRHGRRHYRESYISGQNLEERQQLTERLIGDDTNRSAISQNVKKETNDKFFKSYNSSTSHGSSHTSGIESDSKQRTEEEEEEEDDNAFIDDFDPIERDGPPCGGVINVTQEHLQSPQLKNLSVSDLAEPRQRKISKETAPESSSSESAKSEQTVKALVHHCISPPEQEQNLPLVNMDAGSTEEVTSSSPSYHEVDATQSPHECNYNINSNSNGSHLVLLKSSTLTQKTARLAGTVSNEPTATALNADNQQPTVPVSDQSDYSPDKTVLASSSSHDVVDHAAATTCKPVGARSSHPGDWVLGKDWKTYYDDTHTIQLLHRSKSIDFDCNRSTASQSASSQKRGGSSSHHHRHHHRGKHSDKSGSMLRSGSADSSLRTGSVTTTQTKAKRSSRKQHQRHCRRTSAQDGDVRKQATLLSSGPHFGAAPRANASVDDLSSARNPALPGEHDGKERGPYLPTSASREHVSCRARADETAAYVHMRQMSDACHKTIAAQHRKLSDSRGSDQRREQGKGTPGDKRLSMEPTARGAPGFTPAKHEVLLRTKHEKATGEKRRPVSYHLASSAANSLFDEQYNTCCNDAALTSRPPVFIDTFKEVIV